MDLFLAVKTAVAQGGIGNVADIAGSGASDMGAADEIDPVADGKAGQQRFETRRVGGEGGDGFLRAKEARREGKGLQGVEFREDNEVGAVFAGDACPASGLLPSPYS